MSFSVSIWRDGQKSNPNGPQDPGVIAGKAIIDTVTPTSTDANVHENVKRAFVLVYGAANVADDIKPMDYISWWDQVNQQWILVCIVIGTITVNDGQPKPLIVEVAVTV